MCVTVYQVLHKSIRMAVELATDKETWAHKRLNASPQITGPLRDSAMSQTPGLLRPNAIIFTTL